MNTPDLARLLLKSGGSQEQMHELLHICVSHYSNSATQLSEAVTSRNQQQAILLTHSLKGVGDILEMPELRRLCHRCEQSIRAGDWQIIEHHLPEIEQQLTNLFDWIRLQLPPNS